VNVADDPALCTFFFPALVRRGDLVAGISSSGACPRLTARLRERLEKDWPANLGDSLDTLREERRRLKGQGNADAVIRELDRLISEAIKQPPVRSGKDCDSIHNTDHRNFPGV
jgi:siroheme synthase-like protein